MSLPHGLLSPTFKIRENNGTHAEITWYPTLYLCMCQRWMDGSWAQHSTLSFRSLYTMGTPSGDDLLGSCSTELTWFFLRIRTLGPTRTVYISACVPLFFLKFW